MCVGLCLWSLFLSNNYCGDWHFVFSDCPVFFFVCCLLDQTTILPYQTPGAIAVEELAWISGVWSKGNEGGERSSAWTALRALLGGLRTLRGLLDEGKDPSGANASCVTLGICLFVLLINSGSLSPVCVLFGCAHTDSLRCFCVLSCSTSNTWNHVTWSGRGKSMSAHAIHICRKSRTSILHGQCLKRALVGSWWTVTKKNRWGFFIAFV